MKALITGASGFVGGHLAGYLSAKGFEVIGTGRSPQYREAHRPATMQHYALDLRDPDAVRRLLADVRPGVIFHLAAQAFVPESFQTPWDTLENNIRGQVNLFEAMLKLELDSRVLVASSAEVYGKILPEENPVDENQPFRPANPYSVSKVAQDMLALQYHVAYGLPTLRARAFNHIGPGQDTRFALPNFAAQIVAAESTDTPAVIEVGNLSVRRDFTDVRDVVRAYHDILMHGQPGEVYNVCRGEAFAMQDLLDRLCRLSPITPQIRQDTGRLRPIDVPLVVGNPGKLRQHTGWQAKIDIDQSLSDILDHLRTSRITTA